MAFMDATIGFEMDYSDKDMHDWYAGRASPEMVEAIEEDLRINPKTSLAGEWVGRLIEGASVYEQLKRGLEADDAIDDWLRRTRTAGKARRDSTPEIS
jgi:hypothetical protein